MTKETITKETTKEYRIDATGRSIGRVASEVAIYLMGKNTPEFERRLAPDVSVTILEASKIKIAPKKMKQKIYLRYSGYPGGQKSETLSHLIDKKGYEEVFRRAVYGMLPANRLRARMMKNLYIED